MEVTIKGDFFNRGTVTTEAPNGIIIKSRGKLFFINENEFEEGIYVNSLDKRIKAYPRSSSSIVLDVEK